MVARGGRRQGRAGAQYPNRNDLQLGQRLPVAAPSGGAYGDRTRLEEAQRAVPLRPAPSTPSGAVPGGAGGPLPPPAPPLPLDAPTVAPTEPVTAGSAYGPGPGPEALGPGMSGDLRAEDVEAMRRYLPMFEAMASQPNASPATRSFVRRLRAAVPPGGAQ